jgi:plastocyanin
MHVPQRGGPAAAALLALLAAALSRGEARADDPVVVQLTLRDHRFTPEEVRVPAGRPVVLELRNEDPTAEELDSKALKVEKVVAGGKTATVHVRPLPRGRYPFVGEYHEATAKGVVVAE